jgi:hypothetical protein
LVSERIGHVDVGFLLQTYAHVLKNDDVQQQSKLPRFP